ncbi:unnamed protein product [Heterobilharzia americana]|nr:unnamed protein product [Heterobilharzia americana]
METSNSIMNCFSAFDECLHDPICLQYYINLRYGCPAMNNQFNTCRNTFQCINAIKGFHNETNSFVNKAISCTCEKNDLDCQQIQKIFVPTCIRQSSGLQIDCYHAWIQCQNDAVCRTNYDLLVSECQNPDGLCSLNPTTCLNSYRRLWTGSWAGGCSCEVAKSKQETSDNSPSGCNDFGKVLTQPPCIQSSVNTTQKENEELKEKPLSCVVMDKVKTLPEDFLRLPQTYVYQESSQSTADCSLLCSCYFGCRYEMCFWKETNVWHAYYLSNHTNQQVSLPTRIQTINIYRPNLSLACIYLPKLNRQCLCYQNDQVVCNVVSQQNQYIVTGHKLLIDFDVDMYSTTIDLLADDKSLSEYEFYGSIVQLELLLTKLISHLIGQSSCRLLLSTYQTVNNKNVWLKHKSSDGRSAKFVKRLEYLLAVSSDKYYGRNNQTEYCINSLELLNIMINDQYLHIKYHPQFSTFQKSILKAPVSNEYNDLNKNSDSIYRLQQLQRHHQQTQSWRHTRTSLQSQRHNEPVKNNCQSKHLLTNTFYHVFSFSLYSFYYFYYSQYNFDDLFSDRFSLLNILTF